MTDKLRSYEVAYRELIPDSMHDTSQYANTELHLKGSYSHQPTRARERVIRRSKSITQAQSFLDAYASVYNVFNLGRHLVSAENYRSLRTSAFTQWNKAFA